MIQINDLLSPLEALIEMKTTDLLLIIHSEEEGAEEVLTGKLLDYIRAEKPILAITTKNCGIRKFLAEMDIGIWANINDINDISENIINILRIFRSDKWYDWCKENTINSSKISKYSRESQYEKFEKFLIKMVNNKIKGVKQ
jgi:glycosyltransferase involved in cell wall biosynthesis